MVAGAAHRRPGDRLQEDSLPRSASEKRLPWEPSQGWEAEPGSCPLSTGPPHSCSGRLTAWWLRCKRENPKRQAVETDSFSKTGPRNRHGHFCQTVVVEDRDINLTLKSKECQKLGTGFSNFTLGLGFRERTGSQQ